MPKLSVGDGREVNEERKRRSRLDRGDGGIARVSAEDTRPVGKAEAVDERSGNRSPNRVDRDDIERAPSW